MLIDYLQLGVRNLSQRGLRSWLTMIGIFIGIAAIVAIVSLGQGMKDAIGSQFASLGADTVTVQAAGGGFGPPGTAVATLVGTDDLKVVKRVRGVEQAFGRLIEPVRVIVDREQDSSFLVSISDEPDEIEFSLSLPTELVVESGRTLTANDCSKLLIGNDLSKKSILVRELKLNDKILIERKSFDVVGILKKTGNPQLDITLFAPETCVREVVDEDEKYGLIVAKIDQNQEVNTIVERINKDLRKSRDVDMGKEDFSVESSQEVLETLNTVVGVVQWVLIGLAGISLLVGGVGITNTMYTSVLERTKEIGIMKAIGARNGDVLLLFLIESGLLGLAGGIIGVTIGISLAFLVQVIAQSALGTTLIEANLSPFLILGTLLFSFLVGSISGLLPAKQAAYMKPVEALRYG